VIVSTFLLSRAELSWEVISQRELMRMMKTRLLLRRHLRAHPSLVNFNKSGTAAPPPSPSPPPRRRFKLPRCPDRPRLPAEKENGAAGREGGPTHGSSAASSTESGTARFGGASLNFLKLECKQTYYRKVKGEDSRLFKSCGACIAPPPPPPPPPPFSRRPRDASHVPP